jgi:hypothetical protein
VIAKAFAQRQYSQNDRQKKSDLMDYGVQQKAADRRHNCEQYRRDKAMQQAQASNA